jgi:head-tail adaptor
MSDDIRLTRPLVLEAQARSSDGAGGFTETWSTLGTLWAEVAPGSGRDVAGVEVTLASVPLRITVRGARVGSAARPLAGQRFRDGARYFPILAVSERDAGGRYLICYAREEVPQ